MSVVKNGTHPDYPHCPLPSTGKFNPYTIWKCDYCGRRYTLKYPRYTSVYGPMRWSMNLWPFKSGECPGRNTTTKVPMMSFGKPVSFEIKNP